MKKLIKASSVVLLIVAFALSFSVSFIARSANAESVLDVTNAEKLSLPNSTSVGQKVRVSDAFVMSGESSSHDNGFFFPDGGTQNGKPTYSNVNTASENLDPVEYNGTRWVSASGETAAVGNENFPWLADWTSSGLTLTHPAIQELTSPSTDLTGMFVSGAGTEEINGIYTERGTSTGKPYYKLLGSDDSDDGTNEILWVDFGVDDFRWAINDTNGDHMYAAIDDVATPDLTSSWTTESGDDPAPDVSPVNEGELNAGVTLATTGTTTNYVVTGTFNGQTKYNLIGDIDKSPSANSLVLHSATRWSVYDDNSRIYKQVAGNFARPWNVSSWLTEAGDPADIDVDRNDLASEASWTLSSLPVATSLNFDVEPSNAMAGATISPSVRVEILDDNDDPMTDATSTVNLSIGTNPGSGTLSGSTTKQTVGGVVTFNDLSINNAGTGYRLVASASGLTSATSTTFNITSSSSPQIPTSLLFSVQPTDTDEGDAISPSVKVEVLDASNALISSSTATITLSIGNNPSGGTLSGTLSRVAVGGVSTFNNLSINKHGDDYTLVAASSGLTSATSSSFDIDSSGGGGSGGGSSHHSSGGGSSSTGGSGTLADGSTTHSTDTTGCLPGYKYSALTGALCSTTVVSGCFPGYTFSETTGERCPLVVQTQLPPAFTTPPVYVPAGSTFYIGLTVGSDHEDVRRLQVYLNSHGFQVATTGPGSPGNESTFFGELTRAALARFQEARGISPANGYFGPITRQYINTH